ncbi:hypothetical protein K440DRAFT_646162 [Wilcoxina mikolae CBS 423.85]|nr:hypothetical protein K440DRAFT_646162 [Wilcoxina mikolae CBS 423.85]
MPNPPLQGGGSRGSGLMSESGPVLLGSTPEKAPAMLPDDVELEQEDREKERLEEERLEEERLEMERLEMERLEKERLEECLEKERLKVEAEMELKRLEEEAQRAKEKLGAALTNTRGSKGKQREEEGGKKGEDGRQEKERVRLEQEKIEPKNDDSLYNKIQKVSYEKYPPYAQPKPYEYAPVAAMFGSLAGTRLKKAQWKHAAALADQANAVADTGSSVEVVEAEIPQKDAIPATPELELMSAVEPEFEVKALDHPDVDPESLCGTSTQPPLAVTEDNSWIGGWFKKPTPSPSLGPAGFDLEAIEPNSDLACGIDDTHATPDTDDTPTASDPDDPPAASDPDVLPETTDPDNVPEPGIVEEVSPEPKHSPLFYASTVNVIVDDSWLDDNWDMTVHRCQHCLRPFGTRTRLLDHLQVWHADGSPKIPEYKYKPTKSRLRPDDVVVITSGGDMFIETRKKNRWLISTVVQYQVSSQVLWTASPVFRAMFGPTSGFEEAVNLRRVHILGFPPSVVPLDDNSEALEFIFNVLHLQHDRVPDTISFQKMVQVAAICEKYELHRALQPTADKLFKPQKMLSTHHGYEDWLLVSYCFGYESIFTDVSKELILRGEWVPGSGFIFKGKTSASVATLSPYKLADVREVHVEKMRKHIESVQAERSHTRGTGRPSQQCKYGIDYKKCEAIELGHLIQSISEHQLNEDETWNQSLRSISQTLERIDDLYLDSNHVQCSWVPGVHSIADSSLKFEGLKLSDFPSKSVRRT